MMKKIPTLALLVAVAGLGACVIDTSAHVEKSGRQFSHETLDEVRPGRTQEFVLALLGEPTSRSHAGDKTEIWKWEYKTREHRSGSFIFILDSDKTTEVRGTTYVMFDDGKVAKVWQD